jgi:hypothetical protein
MKATLTDFGTGWFGLSLELSSPEIDELIERLEWLKRESGHFHFRSNFSGETGLGDIEVSCSGSIKHDHLRLE